MQFTIRVDHTTGADACITALDSNIELLRGGLMADCPNLVKCPFFNDELANMPTVSGFLKQQFCRGRYTSCARYMIANTLGADYMPANLYPSEAQRANEIIAKVGYFKK